jgi:DeoR/GlpR family transcriptional regulator of sugar metabolism
MKAYRSASLKVQRRRQRIVALYNTAKRFSLGKVAESLNVSRFTVARDLSFLREYDLLSPHKSSVVPFELTETGAQYMNRFNRAHNILRRNGC